LAEVEELRKKYRNEAEFVIVYIKEAHPRGASVFQKKGLSY